MLLKILLNLLQSIRIFVNVLILFLYLVHKIDMHQKSILGLLNDSFCLSINWKYEIIFRAPLPSTINDILKKRIRHLHLATNPVRLQYCTQEIVIFREDLLQKLCRYCIKLPADNLPMHVNIFYIIFLRNINLFLALSNIGYTSAFITFASLYDTNLLVIWSCT